jgi:hypothetical protein
MKTLMNALKKMVDAMCWLNLPHAQIQLARISVVLAQMVL